MTSVMTDDGCAIAYAIDGPADAPPLLLANSLGTDCRLWAAQVEAFSRRFRVVRFDTRGHGASSVPAGEYTLDRLGRDALALLDALGIARAAFCGVSLGGMVGQWLGIHAPARLSALALCNTSAHMPPPGRWSERIAKVRDGGIGVVADGVVERWFTAGFVARSPDVVASARGMLLETPPNGYAGCCAAIRDMDLRSGLGAISVPTLVIGGKLDPATPPAHAQALANGILRARLAMLDAAHLSNLEQPARFTASVLDFLTEAGGA